MGPYEASLEVHELLDSLFSLGRLLEFEQQLKLVLKDPKFLRA